MKYHTGIKLLAFFLAVCMLLLLAGSILSVIFLAGNGLYRQNINDWERSLLEGRAHGLGLQLLQRYTAKKLGNLTQEQLIHTALDYTNETLSQWYGLDYGSWDYWIRDLEGNLMENGVRLTSPEDAVTYRFNFTCDYPVHATPAESVIIEQTENWNYRDYYCTETEEHFLYYYNSPQYMVSLRFQPDQMTYTGISRDLLNFLYNGRYLFIASSLISLALFLCCAVYLCLAAGRVAPDSPLRLRGLCRLPLDLLLILCGGGALLLIVGSIALAQERIPIYEEQLAAPEIAVCLLMLFFAACLLLIFLYAAAAQGKQKNGYWWRRSLIGWCLWKTGSLFRLCFRGIRQIFRLLPLIWQWLVVAAAMVITPLFCLLLSNRCYGVLSFLFALWFIGAVIVDIAMVCYGAFAFGILYKGARAMARGNLQNKVPTRYLFGVFRGFAEELNALADAAKEAAKKQMKSERMRTELITNVSHDIKTPLTSIVNYVDLLQNTTDPQQQSQYLEVLRRQSGRMKKLVEDLMEMSKASSGSMNVSAEVLDTTETVNQALGEFTDKLIAAGLTPVFHPAETPVLIYADGRLTWRVLSNLLSNAVKYAMPGTRLYLDVTPFSGCAQISIKNISAEPLNVSADELTERFVRGDTARNTEGSGLGLNIAQSLMELQKGSLELVVDGDLFKVTLTFPTP